RLWPALAGADADTVVQGKDEDLAVADLAVGSAPASLEDGVYGRLDKVLVHRDLKLDLAQQVHGDLVTAVNLGIALLPAKTLHIHDSKPEDLDPGESLLDGLEFGGLDERDDQFHRKFLKGGCLGPGKAIPVPGSWRMAVLSITS